MKRSRQAAVIVLAGILAAGVARAASRADTVTTDSAIADGVRTELLGLPYYGVFDLLTYQVADKGLVKLGGYVYNGSLKDAAARAVRKVEGVKELENKIEIAAGIGRRRRCALGNLSCDLP